MLVLGLSGGPDLPHQDPLGFPHLDGYWHDSAAVLLADGDLVTAHEQERLSRLKNTTRFPLEAVRACLRTAGATVADLDAVAVYFTGDHWSRFLRDRMLYDPGYAPVPTERPARSGPPDASAPPGPSGPPAQPVAAGRRAGPVQMPAELPAAPEALLAHRLSIALDGEVPADRIHFVRHHVAHAASAWYCSGFPDALVLTLDGAGDTEAGMLSHADGTGLRMLSTVPIAESLGGLYLWITRYLGYRQFDEYKVMGLAPYGDRRALGRDLRLVELLPGGRHRVDWSFTERLRTRLGPRRAGTPFTQLHADLAAAVQDALEEAVLHLLREARRRTGDTRLCLAGGVAHNCVLNAAIAATERFDEIFVQPASHDAGCALGAALEVTHRQPDPPARVRLTDVFLGTRIGADEAGAVRRWTPYLTVAGPAGAKDGNAADAAMEAVDAVEAAAAALAGGEVVAWARGRAEFGPRALGNRSLLADPRPADNRDRINHIIKKREGFRPFAPVVRAEDAATYFELPPGGDCSFMSFTVQVRPQWRPVLAAVTHVDGSARLQTVTAAQNPALYDLLGRFRSRTGVGVLLNTSLNVSGEPIVDSAEDALVFLLTTDVDGLVLGDRWLRRTARPPVADLAPSLPPDARLEYEPGTETGPPRWLLRRGGPERRGSTLSRSAFAVLERCDGRTPVRELAAAVPPDRPLSGDQVGDHQAVALLDELDRLWDARLIRLAPVTFGGPVPVAMNGSRHAAVVL